VPWDGSVTLYGPTASGGATNAGTVFVMKTDGTGFTLLHSFAGGVADGSGPNSPVILDGSGNIYGTTTAGGSADFGTVFTMKTDGTGLSILHHFVGGNDDGQYPYFASVALDGRANLYAATIQDEPADLAQDYKVKTNGTGFGVLHPFSGGMNDGLEPFSAPVLDGLNNLYGTTLGGGPSPAGLSTQSRRMAQDSRSSTPSRVERRTEAPPGAQS